MCLLLCHRYHQYYNLTPTHPTPTLGTTRGLNQSTKGSLGSNALGSTGGSLGSASSLGSTTASYLAPYGSFGGSSGTQACQNPYYGSSYNTSFATGNSQNYTSTQQVRRKGVVMCVKKEYVVFKFTSLWKRN